MKTKPLFAFILGLILLTGCLTPVGSQLTPAVTSTQSPELTRPPAKTPTPKVSPTPTPAWLVPDQKLNGVTVTFWHPWTGDTAVAVDKLVAEFNRTNEKGITVQSMALGSAGLLSEQIPTALSTGMLPDVVVAPMEDLLTWRSQGAALVDLNPYLNDAEWGLSPEQVAEIPTTIWAQEAVDGQRLGLPAQRTTQVLFYNQTWARELGFNAPPTTPTAFKEQVCAAAIALNNDRWADNNGMGGWVWDADAETIWTWLVAFGANPLPASADQPYRFDVPESVSAFTFLKSMVDEGCAWKSRYPLPYEQFAGRQALIYAGSLTDIAAQQRVQELKKSTDTWLVIPFPSPSGQPVTVISGPAYAIFQTAPAEQLAAWIFVRWLAEPSRQAALAQAAGAYPLSSTASQLMSAYADDLPQWETTQDWLNWAQPAPGLASWSTARHILEDAAWQVIQPTITTDQIPAVMQELDAMISQYAQ